MLFLVFHMRNERYAIPAKEVVEILPLLDWKVIPMAPAGVAGLFNYHGTPVPVMDLHALAYGIPSSRSMTTRTVLVRYPLPDESSRLLGLLVENLTETLQAEESAFLATGIRPDGAPYLGPVLPQEAGFVQRVEIDQLLSENIREILFTAELDPP